jgi:hypothetical protein
MAFGGSKEDTKEYLADLRERAGYNVKRKGDKVVGSEKVRAIGIFDNMMGIQPIDVYEELRINKIDGYGDDAT